MSCDLVLMHDSPIKRGEQQGSSQREMLRARLATFRAQCEREKLDPLEVSDRARLLTTTLNVLSQEWVLEAKALAMAAQIPTASFFALSQPPDKLLPHFLPKRANDLTAYTSAIKSNEGARSILVENCDGPDIPHSVVSRADTPGTLAYVALCESGDTGVRAFVNEAGLAGTFHFGPTVDDHTGVKLPPSIVLRHICEKALTCKQVVGEFKNLFERMAPGNPDKRGICYLFADSKGDTLLVEAGGVRFQSQIFNGSYITMTNKFQLVRLTQVTLMEPFRQRLLRDQITSGPLDVVRGLELARNDTRSGTEKGICDADTRASFAAVVGPEPFKPYAMVSLGSPLFNLSIPCFPRLGVPDELVSGVAWPKAFRQAEPTGQRTAKRNAFEAEILSALGELQRTPDDAARQQVMHLAWSRYVELQKFAAELKTLEPSS